MIVIDLPIISSAVYPKTRSAAWFHEVTIPFRSLLMMASSEDSTMAASRRVAAGLEGSAIRKLIVRLQPAGNVQTRSAEVVVGAGRVSCQ